MESIPLGSQVRDRASGLVGIAISRVTYLDGTTSFGVQPALGADGKMPDAAYISELRLERTGAGIATA